jgi:hypothetical protein
MPEDINKFFDVQDLAIHINPASFLGNQNGQPGRMILPDLRSAFSDVNIRMMLKKSGVLMYCLMDTGQEYQTKSKNYD